MTYEPLISQQVRPAHKFLWAVKSYLDLISRDDPLKYGSGLKRLYVMTSGVATFNEAAIEDMVAKAERNKILNPNLHGFMVKSILKNIELYGKEIQKLINGRIVDIANGDVVNPEPSVNHSAARSRRFFYVPPVTFIARVQKALNDDRGLDGFSFSPPVVNQFQSVATDGDLLLFQMQGNEGVNTPTETSWGALTSVVERLISVLDSEARYASSMDYKVRARPVLKILLVIAKMVMGDLSTKPLAQDINLIDLEKTINLSDGTLAAIPFPLKETVSLFSDNDIHGISMRGRTYLSAVSAASIYRDVDSE